MMISWIEYVVWFIGISYLSGKSWNLNSDWFWMMNRDCTITDWYNKQILIWFLNALLSSSSSSALLYMRWAVLAVSLEINSTCSSIFLEFWYLIEKCFSQLRVTVFWYLGKNKVLSLYWYQLVFQKSWYTWRSIRDSTSLKDIVDFFEKFEMHRGISGVFLKQFWGYTKIRDE